ncbi:hypothetical protein FA843_03420 [Salmonella enterica]|nr:hypothetical protein [Salmonella enterica]
MNGNNVRQPACQMSFRHAVLAFAIAVALGSGTASAGEKLDMSFIQGGAGINPEVWAALNGDYAPGRYLVDLSLNGKDIGKHILDVTPQDSEALCLSEAWLAKAGIYVSAEYFRKGYDATRQCWVLAKAPAVKVDFDVATQSLSLAIPQKGLVKMPENVEWDYGTEAFRMNYNANANSGRYNTSAFGSADLKANIGRWVVSSSATASTGDGGSNEATINMFTATRAIRSLSADLAVGKTSTGDSLLGSTGTYGVFAASYGYGLDGLTLRTGGVFNQDWQGASAGAVLGLGYLGAVSADGAYATAKYRDGSRSGNKVKLAWSKQLALTNTGLRVSWSHQSEEYEDMSSFDPAETWLQQNQGRRTRDEWNAGISQPVGGLFSLSASGWQRSYYPASTTGSYRYADDNGKETGITGTLSTQIKSVSLNLGWSGSRNMNGENTWSASASVSVPFTLFERKYSSSTTVSTGKDGGTGVSTGISGALNDRFSYGLGGGRDSDGGISSYLNAAYSGDRANLNGTVNHSSGSGTSGSVSASGSVLAVPAARDIMFSRTTGDTVAVVSVKDTPGVKVMSGNETSDSDGNLVVPLNSYDWNTVTIDAGTLPLDTELSTTSRKVVPTDRAVVWMPFDALKVHRYLLQVRMPDGAFVPGGTWARDSNNTPLGFVANNGVLMINAVDRPGDITLGQCRIPAAKLQETAKLQEITCE